ncbi:MULTISPECIES: TetR/AcrR family transcriptional regulator [Pseudomonas]|jgi:TetR/AcrR family transcriptional regulator, regulator of autoinduction and epiphytic fitness|uniref:TetR/AcrR family transcriptional regulator n=1 Tax=Pseudomonas rhodesiae TaxID=76760 RepID=A0A8I1E1E0_9PSED|nr:MULTISPECIES: TetR/AcrR family transcriptional regulator [Pseudomonas]MBI6604777.1 TetR/AcrR family transcriptional regulator [Pseudomonas sp. S4_EA_1b]MBI6623199.1 TetR/AcrR family transcriptional regulator [Pseudomonas rhodesiae]MDN6861304.1 TetR/AcrR family transcriptional regulator [Pseudomonas rhodesiae]NMY80417.1 TetR/AcrR family transcriptional regulator [Pseudomonas rhodesiae]POA60158.1 TetR/AcrR family transcriptional regulator [Pseudomonas sp. GW531-R1]
MTAPQRLTDRKREAIVSAAISEFRENGFEVTSMDKIAATAGVSKRTVYNHFPSKEELFAEILHQLWASTVAQLDVCYSSDRPLREQLRGLLEAKMKMMSDNNFLDLARVAIAATIHSPERAQNMVTRLSQREEGFTQWVRAAQEDGRLSGNDPAFAAHQIQSLLKAFAFWPQITLGQPTLDAATQARVIESAIDLFLAGYEIKPSTQP